MIAPLKLKSAASSICIGAYDVKMFMAIQVSISLYRNITDNIRLDSVGLMEIIVLSITQRNQLNLQVNVYSACFDSTQTLLHFDLEIQILSKFPWTRHGVVR